MTLDMVPAGARIAASVTIRLGQGHSATTRSGAVAATMTPYDPSPHCCSTINYVFSSFHQYKNSSLFAGFNLPSLPFSIKAPISDRAYLGVFVGLVLYGAEQAYRAPREGRVLDPSIGFKGHDK